jgi:hypothetical protein
MARYRVTNAQGKNALVSSAHCGKVHRLRLNAPLPEGHTTPQPIPPSDRERYFSAFSIRQQRAAHWKAASQAMTNPVRR